jgi:hypothetical protein
MKQFSAALTVLLASHAVAMPVVLKGKADKDTVPADLVPKVKQPKEDEGADPEFGRWDVGSISMSLPALESMSLPALESMSLPDAESEEWAVIKVPAEHPDSMAKSPEPEVMKEPAEHPDSTAKTPEPEYGEWGAFEAVMSMESIDLTSLSLSVPLSMSMEEEDSSKGEIGKGDIGIMSSKSGKATHSPVTHAPKHAGKSSKAAPVKVAADEGDRSSTVVANLASSGTVCAAGVSLFLSLVGVFMF